jgi:electron transfer flavoprotein alpha/beta subunit
MNAAALVRQVRAPDGALVMDEGSRVAVAQAVELCAAVGDGMCTAITVGPDSADDVLREAIAWGGTCTVMSDGVLVTEAAPEGSGDLATAHALADVLASEGPFDLVLLGAGSTGQLGPQIAELLDLPFAASARYLSMQGSRMHVRGQHEDGWMQSTVQLPAVVSCAAGLIDPCEIPAVARALVPRDLIRTVAATSLEIQPREGDEAPSSDTAEAQPIAVVLEPDRPDLARGLLGFATQLDANAGAVIAITTGPVDTAPQLGAWGADAVVVLAGKLVAEDVARSVAGWAVANMPARMLVPNTAWGREVAGRTAVRLDSDRSAVQIEVVHPEELSMPEPRESGSPSVQTITVHPRGRVRVASRTRREADN